MTRAEAREGPVNIATQSSTNQSRKKGRGSGWSGNGGGIAEEKVKAN